MEWYIIKPSTIFPSEKVNNCYDSLGRSKKRIRISKRIKGEGNKLRRERRERGRENVTEGHRVSDKTLLDLFVLLGFLDESHLLWLTAREEHIKEEPSTDKCLFLYNEQYAVFLWKFLSQTDIRTGHKETQWHS